MRTIICIAIGMFIAWDFLWFLHHIKVENRLDEIVKELKRIGGKGE